MWTFTALRPTAKPTDTPRMPHNRTRETPPPQENPTGGKFHPAHTPDADRTHVDFATPQAPTSDRVAPSPTPEPGPPRRRSGNRPLNRSRSISPRRLARACPPRTPKTQATDENSRTRPTTIQTNELQNAPPQRPSATHHGRVRVHAPATAKTGPTTTELRSTPPQRPRPRRGSHGRGPADSRWRTATKPTTMELWSTPRDSQPKPNTAGVRGRAPQQPRPNRPQRESGGVPPRGVWGLHPQKTP
ncbi:hypothetical protein BJY18_006013 [Amycolatopsis jiangsuensis]|uniref:Uncharacterized protein n=1 Tax=Amycolatopsis jiangsuensis TaxID=1181879 RepID=A0A840J544_9PSEU|nr:hypothetical protein [Amycolatopsis jiangsuensis]